MTLFTACRDIVYREILLGCRKPHEILNPLLFFVIVISLFPLALGAQTSTLQLLGPGIIWVAALLATLLSIDSLFLHDAEDGSLVNLLLSPYPLLLLVISKVLIRWFLHAFPLILITPILGLMLHLSSSTIGVLMLSLSLGTPTLYLIAGIGGALTVNLRNGSVLLSLLVLPLCIPILIFGVGIVVMANSGLPYRGELAILLSFLVLALTLAPLAIVGALRL